MPLMLGRTPRSFNPAVPHFSTLLRMPGLAVPAVPAAHDWAAGLPNDLGMMLNDRLGDCVIADGYGHPVQVFTQDARHVEISEPDPIIEQLYSEVAGYDPAQQAPDGTNPTDNGTNMQDFMTYMVDHGAPVVNGSYRHKFLSFHEVDVRNFDDLCLAIYEFGGVAIGFNVPNWLMASDPMPLVWGSNPNADNSIIGGHCVTLTGFDKPSRLFNLISWGIHSYRMGWDFFAEFCEEAYAVYDPSWRTVSGSTPLGLTDAQARAQMAAL